MQLITSISQALGQVALPLDLQASLPSIASGALFLAASYYLLINVVEIDKPRSYRNIPRMNSWRYLYENIFLKKTWEELYRNNMRENLEKYGISRGHELGHQVVYLGSPEYARQMLLNTENFKKILPTEQFPESHFSRLMGNNISISNGADWKRYRRVCNPAFHFSWPTESFADITRKMIKRIEFEAGDPRQPVDAFSLLKRMTLDALGVLGFGFDFNAIDNPNGEYPIMYNKVMTNSTASVLYTILPWLDDIPFLHRTQLFEATDKFNDIILKLIEAKRKDLHDGVTQSGNDFMSLLIKSNEGEEGLLSNEELRSNVVVLFAAGHSTTALTLSSALYYIATNPIIQEKLHAEVVEFLGPEDSPEQTPFPALEDSKSMPLLNAVIKETLRLNPILPILRGRTPKVDTAFGPYTIPPGVDVRVNVYSVQHNAKYWENPEEFIPERFLEEGRKGSCEWMPFSYGARTCAGMNFSLVEQRVVLSMILHKYKITLPADSPHANGMKFLPYNVISNLSDLKLNFTPRY